MPNDDILIYEALLCSACTHTQAQTRLEADSATASDRIGNRIGKQSMILWHRGVLSARTQCHYICRMRAIRRHLALSDGVTREKCEKMVREKSDRDGTNKFTFIVWPTLMYFGGPENNQFDNQNFQFPRFQMTIRMRRSRRRFAFYVCGMRVRVPGVLS